MTIIALLILSVCSSRSIFW